MPQKWANPPCQLARFYFAWPRPSSRSRPRTLKPTNLHLIGSYNVVRLWEFSHSIPSKEPPQAQKGTALEGHGKLAIAPGAGRVHDWLEVFVRPVLCQGFIGCCGDVGGQGSFKRDPPKGSPRLMSGRLQEASGRFGGGLGVFPMGP